MGFRILLALWSLAFTLLLGWLAKHESAAPAVLGRYSAGYFALLVATASVVVAGLVAQTPLVYRRLHAAGREIALTLVSLVVSLALLETGVRVLDPLGVSYLEESTRYHLDKVADPTLGYKHAPNVRRVYQGVEVSTNELGLRDRAVGAKPAGELRILLLGDSVTFGWGAPIEATFARKLETLLSAELGRPVRTINAGVGSYNTVQEYAFLAKYADLIDPDLVALVYVSNDVARTPTAFDPRSERTLRGKTPPQVLGIIVEKSWLYRLGFFVAEYSRAKGPVSFDMSARGVEESLDALAAAATFCRERGIGFAAFFYRPKPDPTGEDVSGLLSAVREVAEKEGFPFADTGPWWEGMEMRAMTNSIVDAHLNPRGHDVLAAGMSSFLRANGLVDGGHEVSP